MAAKISNCRKVCKTYKIFAAKKKKDVLFFNRMLLTRGTDVFSNPSVHIAHDTSRNLVFTE